MAQFLQNCLTFVKILIHTALIMTMLDNPLIYACLWAIATVFGILVGWLIRGTYSESGVKAKLSHLEQEHSSVVHLYGQMRIQTEQKSAELKKMSLEAKHYQQQISHFEIDLATREAMREAETARLIQAQSAAHHAAEKIQLLEENIKYLRQRDTQFTAEITRLHHESQTWKRVQHDFNGVLQQLQVLQREAAQLKHERDLLKTALEQTKVELSNLQNTLALTAPDSDSDSLTQSDNDGEGESGEPRL
jgi:chromosome segregation ATPase